MRWFTSDLHLGDMPITKRRYCPGDLDLMRKTIAQRWDRRIAEDDTVWIVGDVLVGFDLDEAREWFAQRPGLKYVVLGNLDKASEIKRLPGVDLVTDIAHILIGSHVVTLSHYPTTNATSGGVLIHGHTHSPKKWSVREDGQINLHVGWDAWRRPMSEYELQEMIEEVRRG